MKKGSIVFLFYFISICIQGQTVGIWWSSELYPEDSIWFTNPPTPDEIKYKLDRQKSLSFEPTSEERRGININVNPQKTFQKILGIGTALETTTIYAILKNKTEAEAYSLLKSLIDPKEGIGLNMFRLTIGTSDFSDGRSVSSHPKGFYSYQDNRNEPFSIENDRELNIIKAIKLAQKVARELNPPQELTFFASCWSPPPWMKTSEALIGGTLKSGYERQLAKYFRNFVHAYEEEGIPIYAMTIQNEPNFLPEAYPGMKLTWQQERDISIAISDEFNREPKLETKLWIIDHNFEYWEKADKILASLNKMNKIECVDAVAFHDYSDASPSVMQILQKRHPGIGLQFTEMAKFGVSGMFDVQQYFRFGSESYMYWVTMSTKQLDEHNQGPYNTLGSLSPPMIIEKSHDTAEWYVTPEYYMIGQLSKFIRPGAMRIACTPGDSKSITAIAFKNVDKSIVVVLVNQTDNDRSFSIAVEGMEFLSLVPSKSVSTCMWYPEEK